MNFTKEHIPFSDTHQFSKLFLDYVNQESALSSHYNNYFDKEGIKKYLHTCDFSYINRNILYTSAKKQNVQLNLSPLTLKNIESLQSTNTYTITTGHQLCLFTGPLYFIYKILTTINCCEYLNKTIPNKHFVPVYWMASEDHDYEEISSANIFGKKIKWETQQTGKVGQFSTKGIDATIKELQQILGENEQSNSIITLFKSCYSNQNLADATRMLVNELFGEYGLVVFDGDSSELKKLFAKEIKEELETGFSYNAVNETNETLKNLGYSLQVNPREINLFYAKDGIRERIEKNGNEYKVLNTGLTFSHAEIIELLNIEPEIFSPNVITRPLYQQKILPNIAYVGGPGEIAYWLQLKKEFTVSSINFPVLIPRKFALIIDVPSQNKIQKSGLNEKQLFNDTESLIKELISNDAGQIDLSQEKDKLVIAFGTLKQKVESIDKSLVGNVEGELQKALKGIENIEQKIIRALKTKNETSINQLKNIKQKLFPENSIQERHDNFTSYLLKNENFVDDIKSAFKTELTDLNIYLMLLEKG
ncbi:MAG: bacillithiol biosynthesis cysteine-adding enzyme BshC [Bacteroidota bacterium]|nr:bacillithiol biosynthesis cysteine-adding enzyme BshC [Bacteroidota bacterium]